MAKKQKYYVVWVGHRPGIYHTWEDCQAAIRNFPKAKYKSFLDFQEAQKAFKGNYTDYMGQRPKELSPEKITVIGQPNYHSISVDAGTRGNPGPVEYRGVDTKTKKEIFRQGPYAEGTNNIAEFLALVHGLAHLKRENSDKIIYSDSRIAIGWVKRKKCNSKLPRTERNSKLYELVDRAEYWLKNNSYSTTIVKWETKAWGEIPADFGRK